MFKKKRKVRRYAPSNKLDFSRRKSTRYKGKRKHSAAKFLRLVVFGVLLASLGYYLFYSGVFDIKKIVLPTEENEQMQEALNDLVGENIFLASTANLKKNLQALFPNLKEVVVTKDFPDQLVVEFEKYDLVVNIVNESPGVKVDYILNELGYVAKEQLRDPELPTVKIISEEPINPKQQVFSVEKMKLILESKLEYENRLGMKVKEVIYHKRARELHLLTERDFYVWLDLGQSIDDQLKKLKKALLKLDIWEENLLYIDLRIPSTNGERIIYKLNE